MRYVIISDPAGPRGEHNVVCRSWLGTASGSTVVVIDDDGAATRTDACGLAPVTAGGSLEASAPPQRTSQKSTPMDLFDGLQWFALQGETLAAAAKMYVEERTSSILGVQRKDRARSGCVPRKCLRHLQKLATAALVVFFAATHGFASLGITSGCSSSSREERVFEPTMGLCTRTPRVLGTLFQK